MDVMCAMYVFTCTDSLVFVADLGQGAIFMASTENLNFTRIPLENVVSPVAVDYDPVGQTVFWTDVYLGTLSSARVDGANPLVLANDLISEYSYNSTLLSRSI